jgi:site-specific DNA-methyltransferase (adenine-specific)
MADIKMVQVEALIPYARNARTHTDEQVAQIAASIKEFGWTNPILVDGDNGVIAGHGRLAADRKLGMAEVPVIELAHLTETQKRAYILADNRLAEKAGWDAEFLKIEISDLVAQDFDLSIIGFDNDFANGLLEPLSEGLTDPDDTPEPPANPVTQPGDIWVLENHRVMCGDSTVVTDVEMLMGGQMADMLLTDPPYNVAYEGKTKEALKMQNDAMENTAFRQFLRDAFSNGAVVMKPGAVFYIWHSDLEGYNFRGACIDAGLHVRQCLIWRKNAMIMGRQDYHWQHEPCLYGWKDGSRHLWASDRKQTTILDFDKPRRNGEHPTMKPVALFEYQMLNNTKCGDIVLDLFGGSGTTIIAAEKNGRYARLMELDPKYVDVIIKRWQEFTGKKATRQQDGVEFDALIG